MSVSGIDEITFASNDLPTCERFFSDWGLHLLSADHDALVFETLNGCRVIVAHSQKSGLPEGIEPDPTLREVVWGVETLADLDRYRERLALQPGYVDEGQRIGCKDPNGMSIRLQVSRKRAIETACAQTNTWNAQPRVNQQSPAYDRATPIEVGHVVFFVKDLAATTAFYQDKLGFEMSDRYPDRGNFMRCAPDGGHHDMFLLQLPEPRAGLNHVAFAVRDLHEVIGGGMNMSRQGWHTDLGPGRHPISSAMFWYFSNPAGALVEYYTDEDQLTAEWTPRDFTPGPTVFAEWAIAGGIDGNTRRQKAAQAPDHQFLTSKS